MTGCVSDDSESLLAALGLKLIEVTRGEEEG